METASTAAVLLLNLPPSALGGIDLLSFTTTPRFQGIKNLPRGFHFVFTGATSALSIRHGSWLRVTNPILTNTTSPDLFIQSWDVATESLTPDTSPTTLLHHRANLGPLWRDALSPYRQSALSTAEESNEWLHLTDCITPTLLTRILGTTWTLSSASSSPRDRDEIPGLSAPEILSALPETPLNFLPIDLKQTWREGATGRERTDAARDRSWALSALAAKECEGGDWMEVLGEMEFCFLMVLTLSNYSCHEQWRRILELVFTCEEAVGQKAEFFVRAIAVVRLQLRHVGDVDAGVLFDLSEEGAGFLKGLLGRFKRGLERLPGAAKQDVLEELEDLLDWLRDTQGWSNEEGFSFARSGMVQLEDGEEVELETTRYDEDDEQGEYAPVIVDLSPEMMKLLGVERSAGMNGNATPNLRDRLRNDEADDEETRAIGRGSEHTMNGVHAEEEDDESEEDEMDLDEMDARY